MKYQLLLLAFFSALLFTACQKDNTTTNCRTGTLGVYEGGDGFRGDIAAELKEGAGEKGIVLVYTWNNPNFGGSSTSTVTGDFNDNCSVLTVPKQTVGSAETSANLTLVDKKLAGTITINGNALPISLDKK